MLLWGGFHSPHTGRALISPRSPLVTIPCESQPYPTECHASFGRLYNRPDYNYILLKVEILGQVKLKFRHCPKGQIGKKVNVEPCHVAFFFFCIPLNKNMYIYDVRS
jgi:hypothetical protein